MQNRSGPLDDITNLFTNAVGAVKGVGDEVKAMGRSRAEQVVADLDLITRDEFEILKASMEKIQNLQTSLFDRTPASAVPLAILLDEQSRAVAIYRGSFNVTHVLQDWKAIQSANAKQLYHLSPPLRGTWFTNPLSREDVIRLFVN